MRYFQHQKPPHYSIKSILCVHNPDHTKTFEGSFTSMEEAARTFPPGWNQEEPKTHRAQTILSTLSSSMQDISIHTISYRSISTGSFYLCGSQTLN